LKTNSTENASDDVTIAAVYGIVKQLSGYIEVESQPARGSTFTSYLPKTEQAAQVPNTSCSCRAMPPGRVRSGAGSAASARAAHSPIEQLVSRHHLGHQRSLRVPHHGREQPHRLGRMHPGQRLDIGRRLVRRPQSGTGAVTINLIEELHPVAQLDGLRSSTRSALTE
jgi:hypothetical protein